MEWEKKLGTVSRVLQCYILAASRVKCGGLSLEIAPVKLEVMPAPPTHEANIGKALRVFFGHRDLLRRRVCQYRMGETSFFLPFGLKSWSVFGIEYNISRENITSTYYGISLSVFLCCNQVHHLSPMFWK